jgi:DNA ligase-1
MPEILEGESIEIQGSARLPYVLKNVAGVYSCSCPAWRNQSNFWAMASVTRSSCRCRSLAGSCRCGGAGSTVGAVWTPTVPNKSG